MTNKKIAAVLKETATLIELTGGNPFRARAFQSAARTIDRSDERVEALARAGTLTDIAGIGAGLAAQITSLVDMGSFDVRDELLASLPPGLLDVLRVKGLGAKKVRTLWKELDVTSLDTLEAAAASGKLATLDGFGRKTAENVLAQIQLLRQYGQQRRYADALALAAPLLDRLRAADGIAAASYAGDLRRMMETVDGLDFVAATEDPSAVVAALRGVVALQPEPSPRHVDDATRLRGVIDGSFSVRITVAPPDAFGTALWQATGSAAFLTAFADRYGAPEQAADEATLFAAAGIAPILPELRENRGELDAAAEGSLPVLISFEDLKGTLHNHSTYSDGAHTLAEMAEAAQAMGMQYFGICDHSRSLAIANGMSVERVQEQQEEIRTLNAQHARQAEAAFRIFSGIESDILADGSLDYPEDVLASFDFVVASVHSGFNMTADEATERIIRAVRNPFTTILGHPTGRLLLSREGYPIHHDRIIEACAEAGVAIELNANPYRLDMDWRWIRHATERGVMISINPDAHATDQLPYMRWGVAVARKGWLTAAQCLNALPLDAFERWLDARRPERARG